MKKAIIEFTDFHFQYRAQSTPTLFDINLTIYEGEKVLIVGPSGSGKSTLAHCINGLVPFYYPGEMTGSAKVVGKDTKKESVFSLSDHVGTVLQDPDSQFIGLTVAEDIGFKLENNCVPQDVMKKKVEAVSKLVGIDTHLQAAPHDLSGGQKQRVTVGGVMVENEDILLFDEPLASLDPATGKVAIELIDYIQKESNKTVVIIEHRLEDVLHRHVDRVIVMSEGRIVADVTPNELVCSDLLETHGIREPLYVTALKYAGCMLQEETNPAQMDTLQVDTYQEQLQNWKQLVQKEEKEQEEAPILELRNVSFGYTKEKNILQDISFSIQKGEMVSIVGRNGAGKSTITKLIGGLYKPNQGQIFLNGRDVSGDTIKERSHTVGIVLQNPNQMISKTMIYDEVAFGLRMRNVPEQEVKQRVHDTLKVCGLYEFRNWPISALSFGQKKRVTIASVLVMNPSVVLLDEPTAGQDFKHYTEIMEFLVALNQQGVTIVMITHDMHLMLEYTDRAIVLSDGRKIADDTAVNVLTNAEVVQQANLKETSLHQLAQKANIQDTRGFVNQFIQFDREVRRN